MTSNKITNAQRTLIAKRLALLPESKKAIFRQTLEKEGIDPWQLPIVPQPVQEQGYPLSYSQQRLWFIEQMEAGNPMYNEFFALRFVGDLHLPAFNHAINKVIERHHILRTNYVNIDGEGRQRVHDFTPLPLHSVTLPVGDTESLNKMMREQAKQPFDLSSDPHMIRATLVSQEPDSVNQDEKAKETIGLFTVHHIAFDALSIVYFMQELDKEYRLYNSGDGLIDDKPASSEEPESLLQYSDYAQWQREWAGSSERQRQADYWQEQLADAPASLDIATEYKRPEVMTYEGSVTDIALPVALTTRISALAKQENATLYMVMLAAFNILLSRYSRQDDICVGTSISNRPGVELEELIGFFVNTLVMRNQIKEGATFSSFLASVNDVAINAYSNKDLPFDQLLTLLEIDREQNTTPLFQALFVLNNALDELSLDLGDVDVSIYPTKQHYSRFDLSLRVTESATVSGVNGLSCEIEYNTALYSQSMIETMLGHYQHLLEQIVANPNIALEQLSIITKEQAELSDQLNKPSEKAGLSGYQSIQAQFESWVDKTPNALALVYEQQRFTYQELNQQVNRIAHYLREQGVNKDKPVGILFERSSRFIVSMLAVLKAGSAYVPLDHHWPADRLEQIACDCELDIIISEQSLTNLSPEFKGQWLLLDEQGEELHEYSDANPSPRTTPQDSAYLIYTSGSTGTPKGVVIEHRHLQHYIANIETRFGLAGQSFGLISTMAADLGNTSIYGALCFGGALHVISETRASDAHALNDYCQDNHIDVLKIVPSHLQGLITALESETGCHLLPKQCLILGGEACPISLVKRVQTMAPNCRVINHYGPTETTVGALAHEYSEQTLNNNLFNDNVPVGRPLNGNQLYVVDQCSQRCADGVPGELWISGGSVARGYHNREALTQAHFVANPFVDESVGEAHAYCYRTGDRVRRLSNGEIEFLGRLDSQVKIRGYRVELGEVESALRGVTGVQQAVVITTLNEINQNQLAAYVVLESDANIDVIQQDLKNALPDYMMPQWVLAIEQMPITRNGKIDRKALPSPQSILSDRDTDNASGKTPSDEKEQKIVGIWSEILGIEHVYADDNFFELGGDSILSLQVIAKAKRAGLKLLPKQLFEHQTVEALAKVATPIVSNKPEADKTITGDVVTTPIQDWFFSSQHAQSHHWNQSLILEAKQAVNADALISAVSQLVRHHDQLRCTVAIENNTARQQLLPWNEQLGKQYYVQTPLSDDFVEQVNEYQASLSFSASNDVGQLFKLVHFKADQPSADRLLLVAHHLLVDGVSWRVLMEDLLLAYQHALSGSTAPAALSNKTLSFKDWAKELQQAATQNDAPWHQQASAYWQAMQEQLKADHPLLMPASTVALADTQVQRIKMDANQTKALLQAAPKAYKTRINDLLLSALSIAVQRQCENENVYVELEGHGREELAGSFDSLDVSRTVGWFTSRFPLLLVKEPLGGADNAIGELIQSTKEQLRAVPSNGLAYGVLTRLGDMPALPRPAISFNYLGQVDAEQKNGANAFELMSNVEGVIERHQDNTATHALSINAMVVEGELSIHLQSTNELCPIEIQQFGEDYLNALSDVINHCGDQVIANTPSDFPLADITQRQLNDLTKQVGLDQVEDIYGLTSLQEGILFHTLMAGNAEQQSDSAYFNQLLVNVEGQFQHDVFIDAWQQMIERHQLLRTSFWANNANEPLQVVHKRSVLPVTFVDFQDSSEAQQKEAIQQIMLDDRSTGFDLQHAPLMRLHLFQLSDTRWQVLWSRHHLLLDGWSSSRLMQEVMVCYQATVKGLNPFAHPLLSNTPAPFSKYIEWLGQQDESKAEGFWKDYLQGASNPVTLPFTRDQSGHRSNHVQLDQGVSQQLCVLAKQHKVTLNTLIQSAWGLLLACYANSGDDASDDVVFGMTSAGRSTGLSSVEEMLGLFINTLPVRVKLNAEQSLGDYLSDMQLNQANVRDYEHVSLPQIQTWSEVENGQALFETLLVFENYFVDEQAKDLLKDDTQDKNGLIISTENSHEPTNYPVTLVVLPDTDNGIELRFATHNINSDDLNRLIEHYQSILTSFVQASDETPLQSLIRLPESQRVEITEKWNDSALEIPDLSVDGLFSQQATLTPAQTAVQFKDQSLSYAELEAQSNQLAHTLQAQGVGPNSLVGIAQQRSISLLVSVLAVMKAGAAYVPIDPNYPKDRVHYMLDHAGLALLLADQAVIDGDVLPESTDYPQLNVSSLVSEPELSKPLAVKASASDLAYVIYTSGSTGKPKGVQITRGNLTNFIVGMQQQLNIAEQDCLLAVTSLSFDIATLELYLPLVSGARVIIGDETLSMDGDRLKSTIQENKVSLMQATPVTWKLLLSSNWQQNTPFTALCGGEAFPLELAHSLLEQPINVWNLYGPTETTVWSAAYELSKQPQEIGNAVPIGTPIANTQLYVLDTNLNPVPVGVTGELYIAGAGVAVGYLHNPEMTAERFIETPEYGRLYQTGDLARYRANGVLECLGRIDTQVKVRGYRIELGEIEHCLLQHERTVDAVVNPVTITGEPVLAGYIVLDEHVSDDEQSAVLSDIKESVARQLPAYMMPSSIVVLESLPLTPNGKVDRKALPTPFESAQAHQYEAPQTELEISLATIWQEVLKVERVGLNDNFFELGGHSLLVIKVIALLQAQGINATVKQVFEKPRLNDFTQLLEQSDNAAPIFRAPERKIPNNCEQITPDLLPLVALTQNEIDLITQEVPGGEANILDIYPLGPLQKGIHFHHVMSQDSDPYVFPNLLKLDSAAKLETLLDGLQFMIDRHDALRTMVISDGLSQAVQVVCKKATLPVQWLNDQSLNGQNLLTAMQALCEPNKQWMDINSAPLLRVQIAKDTTSDEHYVLLQYHHLVSDHQGLAIIKRELSAFFNQQTQYLTNPTPYREFVAHAQHQLENNDATAFFTQMLADIEQPSLPFGLSNTQNEGGEIVDRRQAVPQPLAKKLRQVAKSNEITPASIFHAAWALVVGACSNQSKVVFGSVLSGRLQGTVGAEHMMGVFINTLPIRVDIDKRNIAEYIKAVNISLTDLLSFEQTPLVLAQNCSGVPSEQPLFSALMNYRHSNHADALNEEQGLAGIEFLNIGVRNNYPLTMSVDDYGDKGFNLAGLFDQSIDADQLLSYMQTALAGIVDALQMPSLDQTVDQLSVLNDVEYKKTLLSSTHQQDGASADTASHTVSQLFEAQATKQATSIALICSEQSLTYQELNQQANQLAHFLIEQGVESDTPVALYMQRSTSLIVAILAVLKAGGCYLPLDTKWPTQRIKQINDDAQPLLTLSEAQHQAELEKSQSYVPTYYLDGADKPWLSKPTNNPDRQISIDDAAYIIYTSGSTGNAKGVVVEHRQLSQYCTGINQRLNIQGMSFGHISTVAADLGNTGLYGSLCFGGTLHLIDEETAASPDATADAFKAHPVDALKIVPTHLQGLLAAQESAELLPKKLLILGGEACSTRLIEQVWALSPELRIVNHYGPSETTIGVLTYELNKSDIVKNVIPIGQALSNTQAFILNSRQQLCPEGVEGELCIGGGHVTRGYLNRDALNKESFIESPFFHSMSELDNNVITDTRLYKTGDKVRRLSNGELVFLGRIDQQVKVRGYRVELGDITSTLLAQPHIDNAFIALHEGLANARLIAWVVLNTSVSTACVKSKSDILKNLEQQLPNYMVPQELIILESMPVTVNGKVDRAALMQMSELSPINSTTVVEDKPRTDVEQRLTDIWCDVLKCESVGINDDFFSVGGDSILSLQVIAKAKKQGIKLTPKVLFEKPTIAALSSQIELALDKNETDQNALNPRINENKKTQQLQLIRSAKGVESPPVFCLHHSGGHTREYKEVIEQLDASIAVYGIQSAALSDDTSKEYDISLVAQDYADIIQSVQARGPYRLLGWSLGGVLAMAITEVLEARNCKIEFLGLIDAILPQEGSDYRYQSDFLLDNLLAVFGPEAEQRYASLDKSLRTTFEKNLKQQGEENALEFAINWAVSSGMVDEQEFNKDYLKLHYRTDVQSKRLIRSYKPNKTIAQATVWWASDSLTFDEKLPPTNWNNICSSLVSEKIIEGGHFDIIKNEALKQSIAQCLTVNN